MLLHFHSFFLWVGKIVAFIAVFRKVVILLKPVYSGQKQVDSMRYTLPSSVSLPPCNTFCCCFFKKGTRFLKISFVQWVEVRKRDKILYYNWKSPVDLTEFVSWSCEISWIAHNSDVPSSITAVLAYHGTFVVMPPPPTSPLIKWGEWAVLLESACPIIKVCPYAGESVCVCVWISSDF